MAERQKWLTLSLVEMELSIWSPPMELAVKTILLALLTSKTHAQSCPSFRLDQHDRVPRGTTLDTNVFLPIDLVNVTWHTSNLSCWGHVYYKFGTCVVNVLNSKQRTSCSMEISGHLAYLVSADIARERGNPWLPQDASNTSSVEGEEKKADGISMLKMVDGNEGTSLKDKSGGTLKRSVGKHTEDVEMSASMERPHHKHKRMAAGVEKMTLETMKNKIQNYFDPSNDNTPDKTAELETPNEVVDDKVTEKFTNSPKNIKSSRKRGQPTVTKIKSAQKNVPSMGKESLSAQDLSERKALTLTYADTREQTPGGFKSGAMAIRGKRAPDGSGKGINKTAGEAHTPGYRLYLRVVSADSRYESLGSSITYSTAGGERRTMRAFRPQMVYTPVKDVIYWCTELTLKGENFTYHELKVLDIAPQMECELIGKPEVKFSYVYKQRYDGNVHFQSGVCSCLLHSSTSSSSEADDSSRVHFRVRAKTRDIGVLERPHMRSNGKVPHAQSALADEMADVRQPKRAQVSDEEPQKFRETVRVQDQDLVVPIPRENVIDYGHLDADHEPDDWYEVERNMSECSKESNERTEAANNEKGLLALDPNSCPYYLVDGHVTKCRCHFTPKLQLLKLQLTLTWSREHTEERFITDGVKEATVLAYKYKGIPNKYVCVAVDKNNTLVDKLVYSPQDVKHRVNSYSLSMKQQLNTILFAFIANCSVFVGTCMYSLNKKIRLKYKQEVVERSIPVRYTPIKKSASFSRVATD